jgi:hypothetical protein
MLLEGHGTPHLLQKPNGDFVSWEDDNCRCVNCASDDTELWCVTLWDVPKEQAEKILERSGPVV